MYSLQMSSTQVIIKENDLEIDVDETNHNNDYEDDLFPIYFELHSLQASTANLHQAISPSSTTTLQRKGSDSIIESYYSPDGRFILPRDQTTLVSEPTLATPPSTSADSFDNKWEQRVQNIAFDNIEHEEQPIDEEYLHDEDSCHSIFKAWKKLQRLEQEIEHSQQTLGIDHIDLAVLHQQVGNIHFLMGNHVNALESFLEALKIWRAHQAQGESYFLGDMATVMNTVGLIYADMDLGSYGEEFFESASKIRMAMFIQETEVTAAESVESVNKQLQFDPIIDEQNELILPEIDDYQTKLTQIPASNRTEMTQVHIILGNLYFSLQRHEEAVDHLRTALKAVRSSHSETEEEDEELTATILNNIGMVYAEMGWEEQSQECFEAVLTIRTRLFTTTAAAEEEEEQPQPVAEEAAHKEEVEAAVAVAAEDQHQKSCSIS